MIVHLHTDFLVCALATAGPEQHDTQAMGRETK